MAKFSLVILVYLSTAIRGWKIRKVSSEPVKEIVLDGVSDAYVVSITNDSRSALRKFHGIDQDFLWSHEMIMPGNLYVVTHEESFEVSEFHEYRMCDGSCRSSFHESCDILPCFPRPYKKSTCGGTKNFMDKEGYVFVNTDDGVSKMAPDGRHLNPIENLQNYTFYHHAEDGKGNVYLASNEVDSLFVITKSGKLFKSQAKKIPDSSNKIISKLVKGYGNNVMAVYNSENSPAEIRNVTINKTKEIFSRLQNRHYGHFLSTKKTTFFTGVSMKNVTEFHIEKEGFRFSIELKDVHFDREIAVADSKDNAFFVYDGGLLFVRALGSDIQKLEIPNKEPIDSLAVDNNDNVWILAKNLYVFSRHNHSITQVSNLTFAGVEDAFPILKATEGTQEIYIGASSGLYICSNKIKPLVRRYYPRARDEAVLSSQFVPCYFLFMLFPHFAIRKFQLLL